MYDLLALFRNVGLPQRLSIARVLATEPALRRDGLEGGATYWDAATNDAQLTVANAIDAADHGAVVLNHAEVTELLVADRRAVGARVTDQRSGERVEVRARVIVNATGPWTDAVRAMEGAITPHVSRGTKGVHIAVPADRLGNHDAITVISAVDQRVMFVLPGPSHSIIGTTDTPTAESPGTVRATRAEIQYLIDSANAYFPAAQLTPDDVVTAWAGIRPLIARGENDPPAAASREHAIATGPAGVIQITGGKLTTFRAMAAAVTDAAERALGRTPTPCRTAERRLPPVSEAFACTVADILVRRTTTAFDHRDHGRAEAPNVARRLGDLFHWDAAQCAQAVADYDAEVDRLFSIAP